MSKVRNVKKCIEKTSEHMNPQYDLYTSEVFAIDEMSQGKYDMIANAFLLGYEKGSRAKEEEMKESIQDPKKRSDLRRAITASVYKCKNSIILKDILEFSEMSRKTTDKDEYVDLTDEQWSKVSSIRNILLMDNDRHIKMTNSFIIGLNMKHAKGA